MASRKLHPREAIVHRAERELTEAWLGIVERHELTDGEALRVVANVLGDDIKSRAKFMIRIERHGDAERPGGVERCRRQ